MGLVLSLDGILVLLMKESVNPISRSDVAIFCESS